MAFNPEKNSQDTSSNTNRESNIPDKEKINEKLFGLSDSDIDELYKDNPEDPYWKKG